MGGGKRNREAVENYDGRSSLEYLPVLIHPTHGKVVTKSIIMMQGYKNEHSSFTYNHRRPTL